MIRLGNSQGAIAAFAAICLMLPSYGLAEECRPQLDVRLDTEEPEGSVTHLLFDVTVSVRAPCAHIKYALVLEIQPSGGDVEQVRKVREVKLNDGGLTENVRHEMPSDSSLVNYEIELVECEVCSLG